MALGSLISGLLGGAGKIIDNMHTSGEEKMAAQATFMRIQGEILTMVAETESKLVDAQSTIIVAEAKSQSWLARNWRPILMLTFNYIIAHNYIFAPMFGLEIRPIPVDMWQLLKLGIGGYVGGRTLEKVVPAILKVVRR